MTKPTLFAVSLAIMAFAAPSQAKKKTSSPATAPTTQQAAAEEEAFTHTIDTRVDKMMPALNITDSDKSARVHDILAAQYHALHDWQNIYETPGSTTQASKEEKAASLKSLHDQFLAKLSSELTPAQIETVKDEMTVNKVEVTYRAYVEIVPNLTEDEKAKMLDLLKQAREEAIDGRSMAQKSAIFKIYKGKINIYLTSHGHDVAKAYHDWGQAQKANQNKPTTDPTE